jgi:hypothetical protein
MVKKKAHDIGESVIENFSLTWEMYEDAIETIPDEHWRTGEIGYLIPARLMLHAIETIDFYLSLTPEGFKPLHDFNIEKWETALPDQLPGKDQLRRYLDVIKEKTESWLNGLRDEDFLSPESEFPWTGSTVLGRVLYLLEHCRQHFGELNAELRRRGLPRIKWRAFG